MAPAIKNGSAPDATASGSGASGDSWDSSQSKNRRNSRRCPVPWSRIVPRSEAAVALDSSTRSPPAPHSRQVQPPGPADVVGIEHIIQELFHHAFQKSSAVVNAIRSGKGENGQAGRRAFAAKRGFERVVGILIAIAGQQIVAAVLTEAPNHIVRGRRVKAYLAECSKCHVQVSSEFPPRRGLHAHPNVRSVPFDVRVNQDDRHRSSPPAFVLFFL